MDITKANLQQIFRNVQKGWQDGTTQGPGVSYDFMTTMFGSNTKENFYPWLDRTTKWRKWLGNRNWQNVSSIKFIVENIKFEDSIRIPSDDIKDDIFGIYSGLVQAMGEAWVELTNDSKIDVLLDNLVCFTGKTFIADDHLYGTNTIDNKTTSALSEATFQAAFEAAAEWQFANDDLTKTRFTYLLVGEKNRTVAKNIVENSRVGNGGGATIDNVNNGRVKLVVAPEIGGSNKSNWYLLDSSKSLKPISYQLREDADISADINDREVKKSGFFDIFADGRFAAAPTFPHLVYGGIVA